MKNKEYLDPVTPSFIKNYCKRPLLDEIKYYGFYIWWNYLDMLPRRVYWFFQRGYRGFGDNDVWDFDYYLAEVISKGLKQLKEYYHGDKPTKKELDVIIKGFEANIKMMDNPLLYKELKPIFDKGMKLFHRYFNHFWD